MDLEVRIAALAALPRSWRQHHRVYYTPLRMGLCSSCQQGAARHLIVYSLKRQLFYLGLSLLIVAFQLGLLFFLIEPHTGALVLSGVLLLVFAAGLGGRLLYVRHANPEVRDWLWTPRIGCAGSLGLALWVFVGASASVVVFSVSSVVAFVRIARLKLVNLGGGVSEKRLEQSFKGEGLRIIQTLTPRRRGDPGKVWGDLQLSKLPSPGIHYLEIQAVGKTAAEVEARLAPENRPAWRRKMEAAANAATRGMVCERCGEEKKGIGQSRCPKCGHGVWVQKALWTPPESPALPSS